MSLLGWEAPFRLMTFDWRSNLKLGWSLEEKIHRFKCHGAEPNYRMIWLVSEVKHQNCGGRSASGSILNSTVASQFFTFCNSQGFLEDVVFAVTSLWFSERFHLLVVAGNLQQYWLVYYTTTSSSRHPLLYFSFKTSTWHLEISCPTLFNYHQSLWSIQYKRVRSMAVRQQLL